MFWIFKIQNLWVFSDVWMRYSFFLDMAPLQGPRYGCRLQDTELLYSTQGLDRTGATAGVLSNRFRRLPTMEQGSRCAELTACFYLVSFRHSRNPLIPNNWEGEQPDKQKIQIIRIFFDNRLHWQFEVRLLLFTVCACV